MKASDVVDLLNKVEVDCYGIMTPLPHLSTVTIKDDTVVLVRPTIPINSRPWCMRFATAMPVSIRQTTASSSSSRSPTSAAECNASRRCWPRRHAPVGDRWWVDETSWKNQGCRCLNREGRMTPTTFVITKRSRPQLVSRSTGRGRCRPRPRWLTSVGVGPGDHMAVGHDHAQWGADPSGVSLVSITASPGTDGVVVSHNAGVGDRRGCRLARCPPAGDGRRQPRCLGGPRDDAVTAQRAAPDQRAGTGDRSADRPPAFVCVTATLNRDSLWRQLMRSTHPGWCDPRYCHSLTSTSAPLHAHSAEHPRSRVVVHPGPRRRVGPPPTARRHRAADRRPQHHAALPDVQHVLRAHEIESYASLPLTERYRAQFLGASVLHDGRPAAGGLRIPHLVAHPPRRFQQLSISPDVLHDQPPRRAN